MDFWTVNVCSIHSLTLRCMPVHFISVASQNVRIRSVQRQFQGRVLRCLERKGRSMPLMPMSVDGTVVAANGSARFRGIEVYGQQPARLGASENPFFFSTNCVG